MKVIYYKMEYVEEIHKYAVVCYEHYVTDNKSGTCKTFVSFHDDKRSAFECCGRQSVNSGVEVL